MACALQETLNAIFARDLLSDLFSCFDHHQLYYWMRVAKKEFQMFLYKLCIATNLANPITIRFTVLLMQSHNWDPCMARFLRDLTPSDLELLLNTSSPCCLRLFLQHNEPCLQCVFTSAVPIDNITIVVRYLDKSPSFSYSMLALVSYWWNALLVACDDDDRILEFTSCLSNPNYYVPQTKVEVQCMRMLGDHILENGYRRPILTRFLEIKQYTNEQKIQFLHKVLTRKSEPQFELLQFVQDIRFDSIEEWKTRYKLETLNKLLEHCDKLSMSVATFAQAYCVHIQRYVHMQHVCKLFEECLNYGLVSLASWVWAKFPTERTFFQYQITHTDYLHGLVEFIKADWPPLQIRQNPKLLQRVAFEIGSEEAICFMCKHEIWEQHPEQWTWSLWRNLITNLTPECVDPLWTLISREKMQHFLPNLILMGRTGIQIVDRFQLLVPRKMLRKYFPDFVWSGACNLIAQTHALDFENDVLRSAYKFAIRNHCLDVIQILWRLHPLTGASLKLANACALCPNAEIAIFLLRSGAVLKENLWDEFASRQVANNVIRAVFETIHFDIDLEE